jgi:type 1 glutamine amidotransferase
MKRSRSTTSLAVVACAATLLGAPAMEARQAPSQGQPAAQGQAGAQGRGRGGRGGGIGNPVFTAADVNNDGALSKTELEGVFAQWYGAWGGGNGPLTQEQVAAGLTSVFPQINGAAGGRGGQNQTPNQADVDAMMAALPATAPARPKQPRKVLVLGKAQGFVHSSIPLAAKTVEALGSKTGAWSTTSTYDPADINAANLQQYDAVFLDSTTGTFLDDPNDPAATASRRKALLDFVRGGKGLAGIHAATDSYHGNPSPAPAGRGGGGGIAGLLAGQMVAQGDKNSDQKLSRDEMTALADVWFEKIDTARAGTVTQAEFNQRFASVFTPPAGRGAAGPPPVNEPLWPEFNKMIGAYFKWHWNDPQEITVKIDDPKSPLTAMFHGPYVIHDETYTFEQDSFSRDNVHVLTSIDYDKMSAEDKAKEPENNRRTDGDYALSWIRTEGQGRVFYEAHGHSERIYAMTPMLEHLLAGIQYALGDLDADATPSGKGSSR